MVATGNELGPTKSYRAGVGRKRGNSDSAEILRFRSQGPTKSDNGCVEGESYDRADVNLVSGNRQRYTISFAAVVVTILAHLRIIN